MQPHRPIAPGCAFRFNTASSNMPFRALHRIVILTLSFAGAAMPMRAQVLSGILEHKGGGLLQTCDTSLHVDFTVSYLDNYACQFTPSLQPGSTQITGSTWHYYDYGAELWQQGYGAPIIPYSTPQPYPVCYAVDAYDLVAAQPCSAVVCKVVAPFEYAACSMLAADFTIGSVDGNTITFTDLSSFPDGQITAAFWNFGDGTSIAASNPSHTFTGPGPHSICLTVVGAPPLYCTSTVCQWLYMGPSGLACDEFVDQGFVVLAYQNLVGVLDTSTVYGMNKSVDWDFGDGAHATGTVAVHEYQSFQAFDLCGTLRVWGPLLSDTCVSTICEQVFPVAAVSVMEAFAPTDALAWPSPFTDELRVTVPPGGGELLLLDAAGRMVLRERWNGAPTSHVLLTSALPPGCYTLVSESPGGRRAQRVVKQP